MKINYTILATCLLFITSCSNAPKDPNKQIDEGKITGEVYTSDEMGWTIHIPKGYTITSKDQREANDQKGLKAIEKTTGTTISTQGMKHLVSFQKDKFNSLSTTIQSMSDEDAAKYNETVQQLYDIIYNTFQQQGIRVDTTSGTEVIAGKRFYAFYDKIYSKEGKVILNQILYSKIINHNDFSVNINYNSDAEKDVLMNVFKNSTFK